MTSPVANLIETLSSTPGLEVKEAGSTMLAALSGGTVSIEAFQEDPRVLMRSEHGVSRYLAQVVWRAIGGGYESLDEIVAGLYGVLDRNPPVIEAASPEKGAGDPRVVIPEARILRVGPLVRSDTDGWEASFEAQVTSGQLRNQEIAIHAHASVNPSACFIVPYFWIHARVAAYNLVPGQGKHYSAGPDTFFVLEPLRQVNATAVARSLHCPKPQIDQIRKGRGDVTVHTLKGMVVHSMLDRIIEGEDDLDACYVRVLPDFLVQLASIADESFDEDAFRADVFRHAKALKEFVALNPHMRRDPQVELRRYSATIGIQGRIDAVFKSENKLDIVELKTGRRIRSEDHAQLFIYRLLLSDQVRRARTRKEDPITLTARLLSSHDGTSTPLGTDTNFLQVLQARNRIVAHANDLGRSEPHVRLPYAGYESEVCNACPSWTRSRCGDDSVIFGDMPDAAEARDLAYYRKFSRLVQREGEYTARDLADLLDDSRLGYRVRNFRTLCGARCVGMESGSFTFEFEENTSDLNVGDRVVIHSGAISSTPSYHGHLRSIDAHAVNIRIPLNNISRDTFGGGLWTIDRFPSDQTSTASQTALFDFLRAPSGPLKRVVLGNMESQIDHEVARESHAVIGSDGAVTDITPSGFKTGLNSRQAQAVGRAISCPTFHLIWGPPGTGKTRVIPEIVANVSGGVLLGAFTNTALDKMLLSVLEGHPEMEFIRMGRSQDSPELARRLGERTSDYFSEDLAASIRSPKQLRRRLDQAPLVAATAHRASSHPYLRGRSFEMTVVDEAGQLTEPLTLGLIMRARRFVLIGDDLQLPPVVRTKGLQSSLFERLKGLALRDKSDTLTLLDVQYRMHPEIMNVSNRLYYEGALKSGIQSGDRQPPTGQALVFVPVDSVSEGRTNPGEALVVNDLVRSLAIHTPPEDIGVISPFRAQAVLLRRLLEGTGVTVDTVERFQGGEREVIVLSFVRSHGSNFVFDDRRFNVAMTRARRKLVLVAHPDLFRNTKYEWICEFQESQD